MCFCTPVDENKQAFSGIHFHNVMCGRRLARVCVYCVRASTCVGVRVCVLCACECACRCTYVYVTPPFLQFPCPSPQPQETQVLAQVTNPRNTGLRIALRQQTVFTKLYRIVIYWLWPYAGVCHKTIILRNPSLFNEILYL